MIICRAFSMKVILPSKVSSRNSAGR